MKNITIASFSKYNTDLFILVVLITACISNMLNTNMTSIEKPRRLR